MTRSKEIDREFHALFTHLYCYRFDLVELCILRCDRNVETAYGRRPQLAVYLTYRRRASFLLKH